MNMFDGRPRPGMPEGLLLTDLPADVANAAGLPPSACTGPCAGPAEPASDLNPAAGRGERLFTLGEAVEELARRECAATGHDWELVLAQDYANGVRPVAVVCGRQCGAPAGRVVRDEQTAAELLAAALVDLWADLGAAYDRSPADPRESSIECAGLITRIVDITRVTGGVPAEMVPPHMITTGLYADVYKRAGRECKIAECTIANAYDLVAVRDRARGGAPDGAQHTAAAGERVAAPCPRWIYAETHTGHDWEAPNDGPAYCPGWPPRAGGPAKG